MSETLAARAQAILHDWVQSESLRKHCYAVADSMKHFAQLRGEDADLWEAVGLLHDMDYERHPNAVAGVGDPAGTEQAASEEPGSTIPATETLPSADRSTSDSGRRKRCRCAQRRARIYVPGSRVLDTPLAPANTAAPICPL